MATKGRGRYGNRMIGEAHHMARFTEAQVIAIRKLRADGLSYGRLGIMFDAKPSVICNITNGKTWRHI